MKFVDFVCFEAIIPQLQTTDRNDAIAELVVALQKTGRLSRSNSKKITKAVIKRENEASTGMGKGIAVPHVKHSAVKEVVATVGKSTTGIDFSSLDKKPVYSIILIISPADNPDMHLKAMENIFRHLQKEKFLSFLKQAQKAEQIEDLLREADENPEL